MNDQYMTELQETGRTYVAFDFGTDLAVLVPQILASADILGITPTITLAGSSSLLVAHPEAVYTLPEGSNE